MIPNRVTTLFLAFIVQISFGQKKTVKGTVSDRFGPMPGVTVLIKGTPNGTLTDFDGKYAIDTKKGAIISFSHIGYKTIEKTIDTSNTVHVFMKQERYVTILDEVVVTALGIKREKKSLGFAQQSLKEPQLAQNREIDLNNAIAGKIAGIQVLGAPSSSLAGTSIRLRGEQDLLYVVDGIKIDNPEDINTDDIEHLSVLKGGAASALYGTIGRNGVLIITTKKSKKDTTTIVVNHATQLANVYILPKYQNEYGGGYVQHFETLNGERLPNYAADESWGPRLDGTLVRHWDSWIPEAKEFGELRPWAPNPDNVKRFFETGVTHNTSLSFSKSGTGYSTKITLRNIDTRGVIPNSSKKLQQFGVHATFEVNPKIEVYTHINYQTKNIVNDPLGAFGGLGANFNQWWQRQIDIDRLRRNDFQNNQWYTWNATSETNLKPLHWDSPFFKTENNIHKESKEAYYGNFGMNYKATEDLSLHIETRRTMSTFRNNARVGFGGLKTPSYNEEERTNTSFEFFSSAKYQRQLTHYLHLTTTVGTELRQENRRKITSATSGGLSIPDTYTIASSKERPQYENYTQEERNIGLFATYSLGLLDLLYVDGSLRSDWNSNANPKDNRVLTFGSSGSFLFGKLLKSKALSFGKLRVGYAESPSFPSFGSTTQTYQLGSVTEGIAPFYNNTNQANPTIKGSVRTELEIGTELQFFKNRIGVDFTYFTRKRANMPVNISLSPSSGCLGVAINTGKSTSTGIEVALNAMPIVKENFTWTIGVNFGTLKTITNSLYTDPQTGEAITSEIIDSNWDGITIQSRVGKAYDAIYGRKISRDVAGNMMLNNQGGITFKENQYLGSLLPDFTGGLTSTFIYKNITLSANLDFQSGGKFFSASQMYGHSSGQLSSTIGDNALGNPVRDPVIGADGITTIANAKHIKPNSGGVLVRGVDATSGQPAAYYVASRTYWQRMAGLHEQWLYDASYVKLRQLSVAYNVSPTLFKNTAIESVSISAFATNLWLVYSSVKGIDPSEIEDSSANGLRWAEGGQLPSSRTFGVNVKVKF